MEPAVIELLQNEGRLILQGYLKLCLWHVLGRVYFNSVYFYCRVDCKNINFLTFGSFYLY